MSEDDFFEKYSESDKEASKDFKETFVGLKKYRSRYDHVDFVALFIGLIFIAIMIDMRSNIRLKIVTCQKLEFYVND